MIEDILLNEFSTTKSRVKHLLEIYPSTRDSDCLLWLAYLCLFHNLKSELGHEAYLTLKKVLLDEETCSMESVRRMRAKLQNDEGVFRGEKWLERHSAGEAIRNSIHEV